MGGGITGVHGVMQKRRQEDKDDRIEVYRRENTGGVAETSFLFEPGGGLGRGLIAGLWFKAGGCHHSSYS